MIRENAVELPRRDLLTALAAAVGVSALDVDAHAADAALAESASKVEAMTGSMVAWFDTIMGPGISLTSTAGPPQSLKAAIVFGYHERGDGGGGVFYWDPSSSAATDGGTIFAASSRATGRWIRIYSGPLNVRWFGAKGDGIAPDTWAIQSALDAAARLILAGVDAAVYCPPGRYVVSNLTMDAEATLLGAGRRATILLGAPGAGGVMLTDTGNANKITVGHMSFYANGEDYTDIIKFGHNEVEFGSSGHLFDLFLRDAPRGTGLNVKANVGYFSLIEIWDCQVWIASEDNANIWSTITCAGSSGGVGTYGAKFQGCTVHGLHLEAAGSGQVPLLISRDSFIHGMTISIANGTIVDHVIEIDANATNWVINGIDYFFGDDPAGRTHPPVTISRGNILDVATGNYFGGNASAGSLSGNAAVIGPGTALQPFVDSSSAPGDVLANVRMGRAAIPPSAVHITVMSTFCTAATRVTCQLETAATGVANIVATPAQGRFTATAVDGNGAATAPGPLPAEFSWKIENS